MVHGVRARERGDEDEGCSWVAVVGGKRSWVCCKMEGLHVRRGVQLGDVSSGCGRKWGGSGACLWDGGGGLERGEGGNKA